MGPLWTGALEAASVHGVDLCVQDTGPWYRLTNGTTSRGSEMVCHAASFHHASLLP